MPVTQHPHHGGWGAAEPAASKRGSEAGRKGGLRPPAGGRELSPGADQMAWAREGFRLGNGIRKRRLNAQPAHRWVPNDSAEKRELLKQFFS